MKISEILLERKQQRVRKMYHGTSSKFLREILKKGLISNPKNRTYNDGDFATMGGVYITSDVEVAADYAEQSVDINEGKEILITVQYVLDSGNIDEDYLYNITGSILSSKEVKNDRSIISKRIFDFITNNENLKISRGDHEKVKRYSDKIQEVVMDKKILNFYTIKKSDPLVQEYLSDMLRVITPKNMEKVSEVFVDRDITFKGKTRIIKIEYLESGKVIYPQNKDNDDNVFVIGYSDIGVFSIPIPREDKAINFITTFQNMTKIEIDDYKVVHVVDDKAKNKLKNSTMIDPNDFEIINNRIKLK